MSLNRLIWLLAPLGVVAGVALGLWLAWRPLATVPVNSRPADLKREAKEEYIRLVASAYAEEQSVRLARARLDALDAGNAPLWVADLAREAASAGDQAGAQRLARLAIALDVSDPQTVALANPPSWTLVEQGPLTCAEFDAGDQPMVVVQARTVDGAPAPGLRVAVALQNAAPLVLVTNDQGRAVTPATGPGTLTLADGPSIDFDPARLQPSCGDAPPDAWHAFRATFQLTEGR